MVLGREFYIRDSEIVAKELLGKHIVREKNGKQLIGKIVETECYKSKGDEAAHMNNDKITKRTKVVFENGGYAYIYLIYGMYNCFNIVCSGIGDAQAVLIRAVEPICGLVKM